jgi:hypothetical protein
MKVSRMRLSFSLSEEHHKATLFVRKEFEFCFNEFPEKKQKMIIF